MRLTADLLNDVAEAIHGGNKRAGWWDDAAAIDAIEGIDPALRERLQLYLHATKIALIHSEVSEMLEGLRKGLEDEHLPGASMESAEAADVAIRLLDYAGARELSIGTRIGQKLRYNARRADHAPENRAKPGGKRF